MIHFVALQLAPIECFLRSSGAPLAARIRPWSYRELEPASRLPGGTWIFADLERLDADRTQRALRAWESLAGRPDVRLLNHPLRSLRRGALLRALHARGINRYTVYPATAVPPDARYPLFLRLENAHEGAASPLISSPAELRRALRRWRWSRRPWHRVPWRLPRSRDLLAVEWIHTADVEGVYRKYSCFAVGKAVVPRHLFFSRTWEIKHPVLLDEAHLAEERAFVVGNPHEAEVRAIFELAEIEFGRIDYTVQQGALQVFEINTNPMITIRKDQQGPRVPVLEAFVRGFLPALEAIDVPAAG